MLLRKPIKIGLYCITSLILLFVAVLFSSNVTEASGPWSFNYSPSQTTWTVPVGVNKIKIQLWGAGGAGGSGKVVDGIHYPGMGGGAGSYAESIYSVSPNDQFVIDIGRGGRSLTTAPTTKPVSTTGPTYSLMTTL